MESTYIKGKKTPGMLKTKFIRYEHTKSKEAI